MNVQPMLEELEERTVPSAADVALFQQQVPALEARFQAVVQGIQATFQTNLNGLESLAASFPPASQPLLNAVFAQEQQLINAFPAFAEVYFQSNLVETEAQLLARQEVGAFAPGFFGGGFFFPGFFPGFGAFGGGFGGFGGVGGFGSSSGFSGGSSGFSGGSASASGDPPNVAGRGMGAGIMTATPSLTLPASAHP
jgi:hypothetical protein